MHLAPPALALVLVLLAGLPAAGGAAGPCEAAPGEPGRRAESARYVVAYRTVPAAIVVGQPFTLDAAVCARPGAAAPTGLRVDAHMPEHRHGMNYRTTVTALGESRYRAAGLLFHMPGRWQLVFDLAAGPAIERLTADVVLE